MQLLNAHVPLAIVSPRPAKNTAACPVPMQEA